MLNKVMLIGYVGADSEIKFTPGGIPMANFSLAVKETCKNGGGEKKTNTLWIRCVAWRRWAEISGGGAARVRMSSRSPTDPSGLNRRWRLQRRMGQARVDLLQH
jgi:single-strand DNA-binding protein